MSAIIANCKCSSKKHYFFRKILRFLFNVFYCFFIWLVYLAYCPIVYIYKSICSQCRQTCQSLGRQDCDRYNATCYDFGFHRNLHMLTTSGLVTRLIYDFPGNLRWCGARKNFASEINKISIFAVGSVKAFSQRLSWPMSEHMASFYPISLSHSIRIFFTLYVYNEFYICTSVHALGYMSIIRSIYLSIYGWSLKHPRLHTICCWSVVYVILSCSFLVFVCVITNFVINK